MHFIDYYIQQIPLPRAAAEQPKTQNPVIAIVDDILTAKQSNPEADTTALEHEIDQLVYNPYNLTPDEIAIVEGVGK